MKALRAFLGEFLVLNLGVFLFSLLRGSWRFKETEMPPAVAQRLSEGKSVAFAHLHEDDWPMIGLYWKRPMIVLVSLSKDGALLSKVLERIGFHVARGSSSRGAVAGFKKLLELVRTTGVQFVSLAVDGPRGPRRQIKRGAIALAVNLESPLVLAVGKAHNAWCFEKSWSKALLPKPFSRVEVSYHELLSKEEVVAVSDDRKAQKKLLELAQKRLDTLLA